MSSRLLTRRRFLTLPLVLVFAPCARALGDGGSRRTRYEADASILYGALRYRMAGTVNERVDRAAGRYEVTVEGQGTSFANRADSQGVLREGRWTPAHSASWVKIAGREGRSDIAYDYERRLVQYRSRSETFFLGRVRVVDDAVALPPREHVDDTMSAVLNHADGYWQASADGVLRTRMVRRRRDPREATEEASGVHRAELVPVTLKLDRGEPGGTRTASFDLTHFSTWAIPGKPAKIIFGPDGRPQQVTSQLMFGTSLTVRFHPVA
jgi:hypothetical protein